VSRTASRLLTTIGVLLVATAMTPAALAEDFNPLGDGSESNNEDMFRDPTTGCENCEPDPPSDFSEPPFDIDWSLALRGSYVNTDTGEYLQGVAIPSVTLTHQFLRGTYQVNADAEIYRSTIEDFRIGAVRAGAAGTYQLDELTTLAGAADVALTRDSAATVGVPPTVLRQPLTFDGNLAGSVEHDFGPFVVTGRGYGSRTMYEPTLLVGPVVQDNGHLNNWVGGGGLRVGYRVTPILTVFVDGDASYQAFDAVDPTLLVKFDAADFQGRAGLSADWGETLQAETSIGYGLRRFTDPSLGQVAAVLYDASVTFRPDETLVLNGALGTTFDGPAIDTGGVARLDYAATGDVAYRVNPWLSLRATAGAYYALLVGTPDYERGVSAGVGADYLLNEHTTLSADYGYAWDEASPGPAEDEHRVTLGVTFSK
jgi:hypothetical protein